MIKIINTATLSSFQDLGRFGKKSIGVSQSGCLDKFSFLISNFLCGNKKNEGAIEFGLNGENYFERKKTSLMNDVEKDKMRINKMSIVYQQNNLLNDFTSLENVAIAMIASGKNKEFAYNAARKILKNVGLSKRLDHFPSDLSVGEQQRVAIARAFINEPQLILADEPTGSLDQSTSKEIFNLFLKFKSQNRSIIFATHNRELADKADYKLRIIDGNIRRSNEKYK